MKVAMLSSISWRTPPRAYGPWELVTSLLTEALVARGVDVTLFATLDSETSGRLAGVSPREYATVARSRAHRPAGSIARRGRQAADGRRVRLARQFWVLIDAEAVGARTPAPPSSPRR